MTSWRFGPGAASFPCSYRLVAMRRPARSLRQRTTFDLFIVSLTLVLSVSNPHRCPIRTDARAGQRLCLMHEPCLFINSIICARGLDFLSRPWQGVSATMGDLMFQRTGDSGAAGTIERCAISVLVCFIPYFLFGFVCSAPVGTAPSLLHIWVAHEGPGGKRGSWTRQAMGSDEGRRWMKERLVR